MTMPRASRARVQKMQTLLDKHDGWTRRTLADINSLGFQFRSVEKAHAWVEAQATLARMGNDELIRLVEETQRRCGSAGKRSA